MPNRGRRRGRQSRARVEQRVTRLQRALTGYVFSPSADPKPYVNTPWNSVVTVNKLKVTNTGWGNLDWNSIRTAIKEQVGVPDTTQMDGRIQWIKMYKPTYPMEVIYTSQVVTSPTYLPVDQTLAVKFCDPENGATLATYEDYGTKTTMGRVGYYYPERCRRYTIKNSENPTVLFHDSTVANGATLIVQVHSLWQGAVTNPNSNDDRKTSRLIMIDRYGREFPGTCDPDLVSSHASDEDTPDEEEHTPDDDAESLPSPLENLL